MIGMKTKVHRSNRVEQRFGTSEVEWYWPRNLLLIARCDILTCVSAAQPNSIKVSNSLIEIGLLLLPQPLKPIDSISHNKREMRDFNIGSQGWKFKSLYRD